jgi:hypothetical protein
VKNNHLYLYLVLKLPYYLQYSLVTWHECQLSFGCPRRLPRTQRPNSANARAKPPPPLHLKLILRENRFRT